MVKASGPRWKGRSFKSPHQRFGTKFFYILLSYHVVHICRSTDLYDVLSQAGTRVANGAGLVVPAASKLSVKFSDVRPPTIAEQLGVP